jgi:hypothetical protein
MRGEGRQIRLGLLREINTVSSHTNELYHLPPGYSRGDEAFNQRSRRNGEIQARKAEGLTVDGSDQTAGPRLRIQALQIRQAA